MHIARKSLKSIGYAFGFILICTSLANAQEPTAQQIITRMIAHNLERQAALHHYTSDRVYHVDYKGTGGPRTGEMHVHAEFTAPGQKHFTILSESGSKMICEKVIHKLIESEEESTEKAAHVESTLSLENYNVELIGQDQIGTLSAWVVQVSPRVASKFSYRGKVWISTDDYAVMRIQGEPAKNPSFWINHASFDSEYTRTGAFWLPAQNVSVSHVRIGGEATLTIQYGEYHIDAKPDDPQVASSIRLEPSLK